MLNSILDSLENLSARVLAREVVFFVGSGFSIDSERNTAKRMMVRLVLRLQGLVKALQQVAAQKEATDKKWGRIEDEILEYPKKLIRIFGLQHSCTTKFDCPDRCWDDNIHNTCDFDKLAIEYYPANDWFCATFQRLLEIGAGLDSDEIDGLIAKVSKLEATLMASGGDMEKPLPSPIEAQLFAWAKEHENPVSRVVGKALFLDTLGFADDRIMGGSAFAQGSRLATSYRAKLYPRHFVLARLAREGCCPNVITTNYDLLLEGAWRQSGFKIECPEARQFPNMPPVPFPRMARISCPHDFQTHGKAVDTSLIVKVHGCAEAYRRIRNAALDETSPIERCKWEAYMRSIVFTYREIQHWRSDSWSRDLLANLQRTRTVAFVGYSLQDPVIHSSFRSVYEEMSRNEEFPLHTGEQDEQSQPNATEDHAPVFFFGPSKDDSFHATEILQAATHAVGANQQEYVRHPNYIPFEFRDRNNPQAGEFPNLDDSFLWLYHRTVRKLQRECIENHLSSIYSSLTGKRLLKSECQSVLSRLEEIQQTERHSLANEPCAARLRQQHERITRWTYLFHVRLLRELALSDAIQRGNGPSEVTEQLRQSEWYFPFSACPPWTAWAVVVELAIRYLIQLESSSDAPKICRLPYSVYPVRSSTPAIVYDTGRSEIGLSGPRLLKLQVGRYDRTGTLRERDYAVGCETTWVLPEGMAPWAPVSVSDRCDLRGNTGYMLPFGRCVLEAPSADLLWACALGDEEQLRSICPDPSQLLGHHSVASS